MAMQERRTLRMGRRQFLKMTGTGLAATYLAGCAAGAVPAGSPEEAPEPLPENVELEFVTFYTGPDGAIMQSIIDRFNEAHDDIHVNFSAPAHGADYVTRIQTAGMAGNPPPVVALHNYEIPPLARWLYDISDQIDAAGINRDDYADVAWALPTYQGQLLGATMSTGTMALYYSKDLFEQAGLDPEQPPTNTEEFIEAGVAINELGEDIWGFARDTGAWLPWYTMNWQNGGGLLNEEGTEVLFNSEAGIEAAQLSQSFVQEYGFNPPTPADPWDLMYTGNLGMQFHGPWNLARVLESNREAGTNLGWAPHVRFFNVGEGIHSTSHIYSVTKQEPENPRLLEAGVTLITWLLEEGSLEWAQAQAPTNLAVLDEMRNSDNEVVQGMAVWVEQADEAKFPPYHPQWGQISTMLVEGMERIVYQGEDPEVVLNAVAESANELLAGG